jgi:hypothetical protein
MNPRNEDVLPPAPTRGASIAESRIKKLIGKKILVRKCYNDHIRDASGEILLALPDSAREETNWDEIRMVGSECDVFTREDVGSFIQGPEYTDGMYGIGNSMWIFEEHLVESGQIKPFIVPPGD